MTPITKEWLQQKIERMRSYDLESFGPDEDHSMTLAALEAVLASMGAQEPVAYMHRSGQVVTRAECCDDKTFAICCKVETPLCAAPQPAPTRSQLRDLVDMVWSEAKESAEVPATEIADQLIDRILSMPPEPVSTRYKQPAPVVPDEKCDDDGTTTSEFDHGWNACRAAMLNGGKK